MRKFRCIKHKYHLLSRRKGYIGDWYSFGCENCGLLREISFHEFWS